MSDLEHRLTQHLEPILALPDPRTRISAYHDMPYAIFRYDPDEELDLRKQATLLETRLSQKGKRIKRISLAECMDEAMRAQRPLEEWFTAEREQGIDSIVETVHSILSEYAPLVDLVAARMPDDPDPSPRHRLHPPDGRAVPRLQDIFAPRAAQGPHPRPHGAVLSRRSRRRRRPAFHGRAGRRAQLPPEDLLMRIPR